MHWKSVTVQLLERYLIAKIDSLKGTFLMAYGRGMHDGQLQALRHILIASTNQNFINETHYLAVVKFGSLPRWHL